MNGVLDRISREPVLGFGAIGLAITAWVPSWVNGDAKKAAVAGILLWLQRTFSTSKKSADEGLESSKYIGAIEHAAVTAAGQALSRPLRAKASAAPVDVSGPP